MNALIKDQYHIHPMQNERDAEDVVQFLLSDQAFDDTRFTPGEKLLLREIPYHCVRQSRYFGWAVRVSNGSIVGAVSGCENEQRSGGYTLEYVAVHRACRNQGLGSALIGRMIESVKEAGGRYLISYTCDLDAYKPIRHMFIRKGFEQVGYYPDYYFHGEGRLAYYKAIK